MESPHQLSYIGPLSPIIGAVIGAAIAWAVTYFLVGQETSNYVFDR
jgi:hypothetical protein